MRVSGAMTIRLGRSRSAMRTGVKRGWTDMTALLDKASSGDDDFADLLGLAGKPFTNQVRLDFPRKRSGHEGVQDAVQPAWNDFGAVFNQTAEALRYALLDAHRFHRHGLRIEAELFEHRCVRQPGCQYSDVGT